MLWSRSLSVRLHACTKYATGKRLNRQRDKLQSYLNFLRELQKVIRQRLWLILVAGSLIALSGCGGESYPVSDVEGIVEVDKVPVEEGTVSFTPTAIGKAVSAEIRKGKYYAKSVPQGKNLVHLHAFRATGGTVVELGIKYPEMKNTIPEKYLMGIEVQVAESKMTHNFELKSN